MTLTSFAGVVVAASGNIPGHSHDNIKRMVEECGARFEKLNVNGCTHIITTRRHVENATKKVLKGTNCEVVGIQWLIDSIRDKQPVNTDVYLLNPAADNDQGYSQPKENSPDSPGSNKRKLEEDKDIDEEPSKVQRNKLAVHRKELIALVDDRFDTQGAEVALWMDERDVRWDVTLIGNPSRNPLAAIRVDQPLYKVSMHRLQILYNFSTGTYRTWFRQVDDKIEEGELYGHGDLRSAKLEFKRLFKKLAWVRWEDRHSLQHGLPDGIPSKTRYIFIQLPSEDEKQIAAPEAEQTELEPKLPEGVPRMLEQLFGYSNVSAIKEFFTDVSISRIKTVNHSQLNGHILRTAIAILEKLSITLTEPLKRRETRNSSPEEMACQANYLEDCYFGLLGIGKRVAFELESTNLDWLKQELHNVQLLLKMRTAMDKAFRYTRNLPGEVMQQAFQALGLAEIKQVSKGTREYDGLADYLKMSVGSLHTVEFKEIISIFRIQRRGESEQYHRWRAENTDKLGQRFLLWHGAGCEKFIGILSQGLRGGLLEKSAKGMFGAGIYFADMSGKSARYCRGPGDQVFMLLCEVEVGNDPLIRQNCDREAETALRNDGKLGLIAHGRSNHKAWMDARKIHRRLDGILMPDVSKGRENRGQVTLAYNEYVVYNPAQIQQRYLFQLKVVGLDAA